MTILSEIVKYKQSLLQNGYYQDKLNTLKSVKIQNKKSFINAIEKEPKLAIIAEIKSKSPTVNDLPERDLSQQISDYDQYGANAVSILTDEKYFGGSFERLQALTTKTTLPVLCKDFIIDPLQIDVAKQAGASMILLIVNILSDKQLKDLYNYAISQNLEVLVEVHDRHELERAYKVNAKLIGVNNRDLKRFVTNVEHTNTILENKKTNHYYISESGIHDASDVRKILHSGIDGLLIGEALMRCDNLSEFLPQHHIDKVCVMVNPDLTTIEHVLSNTSINTIQLHGTESIDFIQEIKKKYSSIKITKALAADENIIQNINKYKGFVDLFIIDTPSVSYGGTGQTYDWTILKHIKDIPYLIAGGINSENIQTVNQLKLSHQGYDLASGIEVNGRKDIEKMTAIVNIVKGDRDNE
ncbi:indole-3-glycerol phosphate synthase TrpC [Staphylococcus aureus]|nr:indole-3-glycerol phosphate synthase TrpC [Staphylococcus aureus]